MSFCKLDYLLGQLSLPYKIFLQKMFYKFFHFEAKEKIVYNYVMAYLTQMSVQIYKTNVL